MKVVILAGGFGTRLGPISAEIPKPMVKIGGKPLLWHIMKIYGHYGFKDFIICLGYKGYIIKKYFANHFLHHSDITIDLKNNKIEILNSIAEPWRVTLLDTGLNTMTGGRIKQVAKFIGNESFMLTYGDGVADININNLIKIHESHNKLATVTAVYPPGRFGAIKLEGNNVVEFKEKPVGEGSRINGGFFVLEPGVMDYIESDFMEWEKEPLENLTKDGQLVAYIHAGFWKCVDTPGDIRELEVLWDNGNPPWAIWQKK